jgi:hypothetical protein
MKAVAQRVRRLENQLEEAWIKSFPVTRLAGAL